MGIKHKTLLDYLKKRLAQATTVEDRYWLRVAIATTLSAWELYETSDDVRGMRAKGGKVAGAKAKQKSEDRYADLRARYAALKRKDNLTMTAAAVRLKTSPRTLARALKK